MTQVSDVAPGPLVSSPELKAQVSYSDRPLSIVRLSVRLSVCKVLHFRLLLQNRWANFNQTWHKSSLGEGILNCLNEEDCSSLKGDNHKRVKNIENFKKSSSPEPACQFQSNLA